MFYYLTSPAYQHDVEAGFCYNIIMSKKSHQKHKAWVVAVDMGYGHQRPADSLHHMAEGGKIISANNYDGIPEKDKDLWHRSRSAYEFISRFKKVPILGRYVFNMYDRFQSIPNFYPRRDLSKPNIQLRSIYGLMKNNDWGKHLIDKLAKKPLPFVTTFFATAFMADYYKYPGEIYCLATDTDISRAWVPVDPQKSKIKYFAPNLRVADRLKLYGVKKNNVYLTGFPLPDENVGKNLSIIKKDLGERLIQLDPEKRYISQYEKTLYHQLGRNNVKKTPRRPLTITFAVGGAGAQRELGAQILKSLRKEIADGKININLVAGIHLVVNKYFKEQIRANNLNRRLNNGINILFNRNKFEYFREFNRLLHTTDILWTKPSELSFYCALGLPIIMAPPIGSQEDFNQKWLQTIGAGIKQEDPRYTAEWLRDWLRSGWLAEAAVQGFLEAPKYGTYNIEKIIFHMPKQTKKVKTILQY